MKGRGQRKKKSKNRYSFASPPAVLNQQTLSTKVIMFLLSCVAEIKKLINGQTFTKNFYYSLFNNILDEAIALVEQRFKIMGQFRFVELSNLKRFHSDENIFRSKRFQLWIYIKTGFGGIEMRTEFRVRCNFCKESVQHPKSHRDNTGTWWKPNSNRSNQITTPDSDHTCYILFLSEIVFFTNASE